MGIFEHLDKAGHSTGFSVNNPKYRKGYASPRERPMS